MCTMVVNNLIYMFTKIVSIVIFYSRYRLAVTYNISCMHNHGTSNIHACVMSTTCVYNHSKITSH